MAILEYKLQASAGGMRCPDWVEDGGFFRNPDDFSLIGWARDNAEWYTPDTVVTLTAVQVEDRQVAIHAKHPMTNTDRVELTEAEVRVLVQSWVSARSE
jgi:hypothetical protein